MWGNFSFLDNGVGPLLIVTVYVTHTTFWELSLLAPLVITCHYIDRIRHIFYLRLTIAALFLIKLDQDVRSMEIFLSVDEVFANTARPFSCVRAFLTLRILSLRHINSVNYSATPSHTSLRTPGSIL